MEIYVPHKGDIVWIDFNPSAGKEIKKRPALVVSKYEFNSSTLFAIVCPITSTIKDFPTRYMLSDELETNGQVLIYQMKSLDFKVRKLEFIEKIKIQDMAKIEQIIKFIFA